MARKNVDTILDEITLGVMAEQEEVNDHYEGDNPFLAMREERPDESFMSLLVTGAILGR